MNGNDFLPNGITPELASRYVNHLKKHISMFEISCGVVNSLATIRPDNIRKLIPYTYGLKFNEAYNLPYAEIIKKNNPDTIIASVGGFRSGKVMEDALINKKADVISLARPLIREPDLVRKIHKNLNTKSACISCNHCGLFCETNERGTVCDYP